MRQLGHLFTDHIYPVQIGRAQWALILKREKGLVGSTVRVRMGTWSGSQIGGRACFYVDEAEVEGSVAIHDRGEVLSAG